MGERNQKIVGEKKISKDIYKELRKIKSNSLQINIIWKFRI